MNSQQLYLNLAQIVAIDGEDLVNPSDYTRELLVHISRGSQNNSISHITLEFKGLKAKFFCCLTFDGSGNYGTGVHNFAMPRIKTTIQQKALACLSVLQYLIDAKHLGDSDFEYFKEKILSETSGASIALIRKYEEISLVSEDFLLKTKQTATV